MTRRKVTGMWKVAVPAVGALCLTGAAAVARSSDAQVRATSSEGELISTVTNPSATALIPITKVNMRPSGASSSTLSFATQFTINTGSGTLVGIDAVNWLLSEFNLSSVVVSCANGTPLLLGAYATCPGSTTAEKQTRIVTMIGLPGSGVELDEEVMIPYITFIMKESGVSLRQGERAQPSSGGKEYVTDYGMHW